MEGAGMSPTRPNQSYLIAASNRHHACHRSERRAFESPPQQLNAGLAAGEQFELASSNAPSLEEMRENLRSASAGLGRTKALTVSNRGAFSLPCDCELIGFRHTNNIVAAGPTFQLNCVSLNGTLYMTLTYVDPAISLELGQAVADAMLGNLQQMLPGTRVRVSKDVTCTCAGAKMK